LGLGEVREKGIKKPTSEVLTNHNLEAINLRSKEGLALLNGTQFMSAFGVSAAHKAKRLLDIADIIASVSLEAYDTRSEPFKEKVHKIRNHAGQLKVAQNIYHILADSPSFFIDKPQVQDPYSYRCIPQVHGASRDAMTHIYSVLDNEVNAVTDNPTIFPESDEIVSAGNFHGQPLAISLDFMAIAFAEIGSISERRIYKLVNGERGLPPFLVVDPGLNSGFMIPQYTAASMVSKNKQLCTPASVDTIDSSNGQEDHVSMGANAAVKLFDIADNVETILGIELLNAMQALDLRGVEKSAPAVARIHADFRKEIDFISEDCEMYPMIAKAKEFVQNMEPDNWLGNGKTN
jgi:histidine ammonia-lyase